MLGKKAANYQLVCVKPVWENNRSRLFSFRSGLDSVIDGRSGYVHMPTRLSRVYRGWHRFSRLHSFTLQSASRSRLRRLRHGVILATLGTEVGRRAAADLPLARKNGTRRHAVRSAQSRHGRRQVSSSLARPQFRVKVGAARLLRATQSTRSFPSIRRQMG
ncbi:unnamed protein product [Protopolystoma xenopodis]|uniref:Uncharacterized protein n=1 Tax=Protopolystoma xenopodis TaxID=117903 RepID=A0A3S5CEN0_9PLAT|nr:unnamed protein product [Protopolystoma xenopodis]